MVKVRRYKSAYLSRQLAHAHNVLKDPTASDQQRHFARCRLNRAVLALRDLEPIPPMKRSLEVDRQRQKAIKRQSLSPRSAEPKVTESDIVTDQTTESGDADVSESR